MAKTKFVEKETVINADFLNKMFGGDPTNASLTSDDPRKIGHVHDGGTQDGHVSKVDLSSHVTNSMHGNRLQSGTVQKISIGSHTSKGDAIPAFETVGSTKNYYLNLGSLETLGQGIFQHSDGNGGLDGDQYIKYGSTLGTGTSSLSVGSDDGTSPGSVEILGGGKLVIRPADTANYTSFESSSSPTDSDIRYVLPLDRGAANRFLRVVDTASGVSTLDWGAPSAGSSSSGSANSVQRSDGSGGFTSVSNVNISDSGELSFSGSTKGLRIGADSRIVVTNSNSSTVSLTYADEVCLGGSIQTIETAELLALLGPPRPNTIALPWPGLARPGSIIYVSGTEDSTATLAFSQPMAIPTYCSAQKIISTSDPADRVINRYSVSGPAFIIPNDFVENTSAASLSALGLFKDTSSNFIFVSGTGISSIIMDTPKLTISGEIEINTPGQSSLKLYDSSGTNYVNLLSPATVASSYNFTLPDSDGGVGDLLKTDGAGNLSWDSSVVSTGDNISLLNNDAGYITAALENLVEDTSPQLGGVLDANGNAIKFNSGSTYSISLDKPLAAPASDITFRLPDSDGGVGDLLKTDGSGNLSWDSSVVSSSDNISLLTNDAGYITAALQNLVEDITPELGGVLDSGGNAIKFNSGSTYSISLDKPSIAPASDITFKLPNSDGLSGDLIRTDGSGNLSFTAPEQALSTVLVLDSLDGTITGVSPNAIWAYTIQASDSPNGVYIINSDDIALVTGGGLGAGNIILEVEDTSSWPSGLNFSVVNDGSASATIRVEGTSSASHVNGALNFNNFSSISNVLGDGKSARYVVSGTSPTIRVRSVG